MQKILRLFISAAVAFACCDRSFGDESGALLSFSGNAPTTGSASFLFSGAPEPLRTLDGPSDFALGKPKSGNFRIWENNENAENFGDLKSSATAGPFGDAAREIDADSAARLVPLELESQNAELTRILDEGDRFLAQRRWFDAKKCFEKGLRSFPNDATLRDRFATARRRQEIDLRYQDSTFVELTNRSGYSDVCAIFDEVFEHINTYHVDRPSPETLFAFGLDGLEETLDEEAFYRRNGISLECRADALEFFGNLRKIADAWELRTNADVRCAVFWIARQLWQEFNVPESATSTEFVCSVVCSLDAYSTCLTPTQVEDVFSMIDGSFVGLGVELKTDDPARVVRVIPNSPASECGVQAGDEIVAVDDKSTAGLSGGEVGALLQGREGERAVLTLRSPKPEQKLRRVVAVRRQIEAPSVEDVRMLDASDGIGYVKVTCFQKTTTSELKAAIDELSKKRMNCLIVDLRQNPGGLLQEAIDVSDLFLDSGTIVQTRGRGGVRAYAAKPRRVCDAPLVLLIDENSASASEIFAGAMQENGRALVVGTQSFGKGTVQAIIQLSSQTRASKPIAGLRLTTEKFYSPKGVAYGGVGVYPDVRAPKLEAFEKEIVAETNGWYAANAESEVDETQDGANEKAFVRRAAKPIVDENAEVDPVLALAVREANRLVAVENAARTNAANVAARNAATVRQSAPRPQNRTQRFVGVSTDQF